MLLTKSEITPDRLRSVLNYDPLTGEFYWKPRPRDQFPSKQGWAAWNATYGGMQALNTVEASGCLYGGVFGVKLKAHRVAWAMHTGAWPEGVIDHINGNKKDNRFANLRDVTHQENMKNTALRPDNRSGVVGVSFDRRSQNWYASIMVNQKTVSLGRYQSIEDAVAARRAGEAKYGFHPNHGRPRLQELQQVATEGDGDASA